MIIWQGAGFVGGIILILCLLGGQYALDLLMGHGYASSHKWSISLSILLAALLIWLAGKGLDKFPPREWVDPKTKQTILIKERHTIFFMPLKYFSVLLIAWAAFLAVNA